APSFAITSCTALFVVSFTQAERVRALVICRLVPVPAVTYVLEPSKVSAAPIFPFVTAGDVDGLIVAIPVVAAGLVVPDRDVALTAILPTPPRPLHEPTD